MMTPETVRVKGFQNEKVHCLCEPRLLGHRIRSIASPSHRTRLGSRCGVRGDSTLQEFAYGLTAVQVDYESHSFPEIIEHVNANTMVVLQIETQRALDARRELLAVPGIDAVMIGPADLSISLGVPGQFQHPKMVEAMEAVRDGCVERGMLFLGCSNDSGMLYERAVELVTQIRQ